jgi:hypothetical protein
VRECYRTDKLGLTPLNKLDQSFDFKRYRPTCHTAFLGAGLDHKGIDLVFSGKLLKIRQE